MRHYRIILSIAITSLCGLSLGAQNMSDLLIGEVLVENTCGIVDGYGQRNGWIELFNTSNGTVKFGGCYLSDDKSDLKKYHIPTSDRSAQLGPRQSVVFYTSGNSSQGTFYTNFKLRNGSTLYLVSNDGRTIIDQVEIPADLPADQSVVRVPVGVKEMEFKTQVNPNPTPGSYNGNVDAKTKSQIMKEQDPHGLVLTLIAVMVVFTALLILSFIFGWIGNANKRGKDVPKVKKSKKSLDGKLTPEIAAAISLALSHEFGGEVYAAIALALDDYLRGGVHDLESMVITIKPSSNGNWADKTQNFRHLPR
ncbi:MAG: lamin tail domain-containing protein [Bacteroidales bacterium]|nr:lamin tail domain-containing protein [Bacteroidales bacterium]